MRMQTIQLEIFAVDKNGLDGVILSFARSLRMTSNKLHGQRMKNDAYSHAHFGTHTHSRQHTLKSIYVEILCWGKEAEC